MSLLQMSMQAGLLIIAIVIIRAIALNLLPKWSFLLMWGFALMRMLVPFSFSSKWSLYSIIVTILSNTDAHSAFTQNNSNIIRERISSLVLSSICSQNYSMLLSITTRIWFIVMCVLIAVFTLLYIRCYRVLRFAIPVEDNKLVDEWRYTCKLRRMLRVLLSDRINTPIAIGIIHPCIILPKAMNMTDQQIIRYVLTHEYFHIRRFDMIWKVLAICAACIHWFNPMVWIMVVLLSRDLEITCDELVLNHFGRTVSEKKSYAYSLIGLAELKGNISIFRSCFSKNALEERIICIMKSKKPSLMIILLALLLVVGTTTVFASTTNENNVQPYVENNQEEHLNEEVGKLVLPMEGVIIKGTLADLQKYIHAETEKEKKEVLTALISNPDVTVISISKADPPSTGGGTEAGSVSEDGEVFG